MKSKFIIALIYIIFFFNSNLLSVEKNRILKVGLLHDIGKVGSLTEPLYEEQDSDWHREKLGQMYKYNENLERMSTSHRTLWLLQNFGVTLTNDEWLAVQLAQGSHFEEKSAFIKIAASPLVCNRP